jgi:MscS family membrane protein
MNYTLRNLWAFLLILLAYFPLSAQKADVSSPQSTVITHLKNLQKDNYFPKVSAKSLNTQGLTQEEAEKLAIRLKQIYDGLGFYVDEDAISKNSNYQDSTANDVNRYIIMPDYPQIYVEKVGNKWLYSEKTVKQIDVIFNEVYPFGSHRLLEIAHYFSKGSTKKYLGLYLWQHFGMILFLLVGFIAHKVLTFIVEKILSNLLIKWGYKKLAKNVMLPVARPLSALAVTSFLFILLPVLQLPPQVGHYIRLFFTIVFPLLMVVFAYRFVDVICYYLEKVTNKTETTLDDQLIPLIRKTLKIFVVISGILFVLQNLDFDITGLLAGISIGGLAFALAAQDTIKNLFGSLMIFVDRPFTIGDWIVADGIDGSVVEVGFRSTRIQTFHDSVVSVPNGKIADMTIDNMGMRVYRRFHTTLAVTYDTPPALIEVFIERLYQIVEEHPKTRKDYKEIRLNSFGDFSLNIMFYIFFEVPSWSDELKGKQEIMLEIIRLADELGVRFAFPTSTVHIEDFPEKQTLTPTYLEDTRKEWQQILAGQKES